MTPFKCDVPADAHDLGGLVPVVHQLHGPVTIAAFMATGQPIGYLASIQISDNEVEVQVSPGTAWLEATPA